MKKGSILIIALFIILNKVQAQSGWYTLFGNDKLRKGFDLHYEAQYRNHNTIGQLDQLLLRTGIGYSFNDKTQNFLIGYGFIHNKMAEYFEDGLTDSEREALMFNEHRIFQQYIMKHRVSRILITHRYRLEERFSRGNNSLRFRYFISGHVPINNADFIQGTFYLGAYNELFMNFEDSYFDRNRTYFSLGYTVSKDLKVELGYLRQDISKNIYNHFQISLFTNIDFKLFK